MYWKLRILKLLRLELQSSSLLVSHFTKNRLLFGCLQIVLIGWGCEEKPSLLPPEDQVTDQGSSYNRDASLNYDRPLLMEDSSFADAQPDTRDQALDMSMLSSDQSVDMSMLSLDQAVDMSMLSSDQAVDMLIDPSLDQDEDGFPRPLDCDDTDPEVNPGVPFTCVWAAFPACANSVSQAFTTESIRPPENGSNQYTVPRETLREHLNNSLNAALQGDAETSLREAERAGYELCAEETVLRWSAPGSGNALLALRTHPQSADVIFETPHAFFDRGTLAEGVLAFEQVGARALLSTGTHRCASYLDSGCSGSTRVCTLINNEDFRISDMAHTEESFFHEAHEVLSAHFAATPVVSLHAFLEFGVSVSDGTQGDTDPNSLVARLTQAIAEQLPQERVTSCNDYGTDRHDPRVCGTTNTQGRHLNGSSNACRDRPDEASGRFIHLEQNFVLLTNPEPLVNALDQVF